MREIDKYKEFLMEEELKAELEKIEREKKEENKNLILELLLYALGYSIVIYQTNIWVALGIYFMLWGNNLSILRAINKLKK